MELENSSFFALLAPESVLFLLMVGLLRSSRISPPINSIAMPTPKSGIGTQRDKYRPEQANLPVQQCRGYSRNNMAIDQKSVHVHLARMNFGPKFICILPHGVKYVAEHLASHDVPRMFFLVQYLAETISALPFFLTRTIALSSSIDKHAPDFRPTGNGISSSGAVSSRRGLKFADTITGNVSSQSPDRLKAMFQTSSISIAACSVVP